jgi:gluconolactonase
MRRIRILRKLTIASALATCIALSPPLAPAQPGATAFAVQIERMDPRLDKLVPPDATLEKVAEGFTWLEGPLWSRAGGYLLFSDIPKNLVRRWSQEAGASVFLENSGYSGTERFDGAEPGSNGLTWDPQGRLVLCQHGDRRIARLEADGTRTVIVDRYEGKRLNSPNDAVYSSTGDLYFTDPPFGLPKAYEDPGKDLPWSGVYRLSADGKLTLLTSELRAPNGLALTPDEKTLYVSNADRERPVWLAYELKPDGTAGAGQVIADATRFLGDGPGLPDGFKVDRLGHLFASGPGGLYVISPQGEVLGRIRTGVATSNCNWGGDGSTLYLTVSTGIFRIRLATRGPNT